MNSRAAVSTCLRALLGVALIAGAEAQAAPQRLVLTGEVKARNAQTIFCPPSDSSPVVLRFYVPDGVAVKKGDPVVRIDPGQALSQVRNLQTQIEQLKARVLKEIAQLDVAALDAERAKFDADTALVKAKIDAAIPASHLAKLDYDRYQGALKRANLDAQQKQREHQIALQAVARRRTDAKLEQSRLQSDLDFQQAQLLTAELKAERDGVVVHAFDNWRGGRIDEGSTAHPGTRIGDIAGPGEVEIIAWAMEPERQFLQPGQVTHLQFDAYPGKPFDAQIESIGGAPEARADWGKAKYYRVQLKTTDFTGLNLLPGMSVRVDVPLTAKKNATRDGANPNAAKGGAR